MSSSSVMTPPDTMTSLIFLIKSFWRPFPEEVLSMALNVPVVERYR
jgi:hypothetical protein